MTADSRACRGSPQGRSRTAGSTARRRPRPPGLPRTRFQASQTIRLEISNGFAACLGSLIGSSRHRRLTGNRARMTRPRRSARITGLHRYHGAVRPYAAHRYSGPCGFCRSDGSLSRQWTPGPFRCARYRGAGSHVPHQSPGRARATSMPDTAWPVSRPPPGSSRARIPSPLSMSSIGFDTSAVVHSRSPSRPIPDALTARRFPQRSPPRP